MINKMYAGIAARLEELFSPRPIIYFDNLPQGFQAPCFFVKLIQAECKQKLWNRYEMKLDFDVMYYPESEQEDNVEELNSVAFKLIYGLEYVTLENAPLRGREISSRVTDDVLHFSISYEFFVTKEMPMSPLMEKLIQKYQRKCE